MVICRRMSYSVREILHATNSNVLYSLKQYPATLKASQQTYVDVRDNHNEWYPGEPNVVIWADQEKNSLSGMV